MKWLNVDKSTCHVDEGVTFSGVVDLLDVPALGEFVLEGLLRAGVRFNK